MKWRGGDLESWMQWCRGQAGECIGVILASRSRGFPSAAIINSKSVPNLS